jgi:hypothetical protein
MSRLGITEKPKNHRNVTAGIRRGGRALQRDVRFSASSSRRCRPWKIDQSSLAINRVHQLQRFFVWQNRLFHLVHHVRECDFVFRIDKGVAAARTGMSE